MVSRYSLFLLGVSLAILPTETRAVTITQTATGISLVPYQDHTYSNFLSFNSSLGTLQSVTISVDSVSVGGSLTFNQGSVSSSTINSIQSQVSLYSGSQGPGILYNGLSNDLVSSAKTLSVSNQNLPLSVARNGSASFTFTSGQSLVVPSSPLTITLSQANDIADYIGTGSSAAPQFTLNLDIHSVGSIGGSPSYNYAGVSSQANLTLKYNYTPTPVPEPSTYGAGLAILALAAVAVRRRKLKS